MATCLDPCLIHNTVHPIMNLSNTQCEASYLWRTLLYRQVAHGISNDPWVIYTHSLDMTMVTCLDHVDDLVYNQTSHNFFHTMESLTISIGSLFFICSAVWISTLTLDGAVYFTSVMMCGTSYFCHDLSHSVLWCILPLSWPLGTRWCGTSYFCHDLSHSVLWCILLVLLLWPLTLGGMVYPNSLIWPLNTRCCSTSALKSDIWWCGVPYFSHALWH